MVCEDTLKVREADCISGTLLVDGKYRKTRQWEDQIYLRIGGCVLSEAFDQRATTIATTYHCWALSDTDANEMRFPIQVNQEHVISAEV